MAEVGIEPFETMTMLMRHVSPPGLFVSATSSVSDLIRSWSAQAESNRLIFDRVATGCLSIRLWTLAWLPAVTLRALRDFKPGFRLRTLESHVIRTAINQNSRGIRYACQTRSAVHRLGEATGSTALGRGRSPRTLIRLCESPSPCQGILTLTKLESHWSTTRIPPSC